MITDPHAALLVLVMAGVTALLRFLPFLVFRKNDPPQYIRYLGKVLPFAVIGMLVVYCLRDISVETAPHGLPEAAACAAVVFLQVWKRQTLLSILGGTVLYMLLIRFVF